MALSKDTVIDKIEILEDSTIQVRRASYVLEDGVRIAGPIYSRTAYTPSNNASALAVEGGRMVAIANLVWTPQVVAAYQAKVAASRIP